MDWILRDTERRREACRKIGASPHVWVGEVSWLKAALFQDTKFIPDPVQEITGLIGERFPICTPDLRGMIVDALDLPNRTKYQIAEKETVDRFLAKYGGWRLFTVSW